MPRLNIRKKIDLLVVFLFLAGAAIISKVFHVDLIISVFLYLAVPALYLWVREKKNWRKILAASFVIGIFLGMAWNLISEYLDAWVTNYTIYPFNVIFIGKMPLGEFVWGFLILFYVITFYEHFLDDEHQKKLSSHSTFALGAGMATFFLTASLLLTVPEQVHLKYPFLVMGILSILPLAGLLIVDLKLVYKIFWLSVFFFVLNLIFEITAFDLGQWYFPSNYIGTVKLLSVHFPFEEMFFWIILAAPSLILCYEFLFDDRK